MQASNTIRETLANELLSRQLRNERYSLRAFARSLGLSPSKLSDIMKGKQGLSLATAREIVTKLDLSVDEARAFCDSAIARMIPRAVDSDSVDGRFAEI